MAAQIKMRKLESELSNCGKAGRNVIEVRPLGVDYLLYGIMLCYTAKDGTNKTLFASQYNKSPVRMLLRGRSHMKNVHEVN